MVSRPHPQGFVRLSLLLAVIYSLLSCIIAGITRVGLQNTRRLMSRANVSASPWHRATCQWPLLLPASSAVGLTFLPHATGFQACSNGFCFPLRFGNVDFTSQKWPCKISQDLILNCLLFCLLKVVSLSAHGAPLCSDSK